MIGFRSTVYHGPHLENNPIFSLEAICLQMLVVGATGVLGRNVVPMLMERGHAVRAVVRRPDQAERLRAGGVEAMPGDILDRESLARAAEGCDALLHLATAVPRPGQPADWAPNDRVRREGTANLLAAAAQAGARRYVQQSITFLYGDQGARLADELTPLQPAPYIASAAEMERLVQGSGLTWSMLRGGAFYGPGTGKEAFWYQAARAGSLRLPGNGEGLVSLIHVADMARAVALAAEAAPAGAIYNVVDDCPVTYRELYGYVTRLAGGSEPAAGGAPVASLGCLNERLKAELGWAPAYPSYRSGLTETGVEL